MILGAHQSIAGGLPKAYARAESDGAAAMQIFTRNVRGWASKPLEPAEAEAFRQEGARTGIEAIAHSSYLINLGSEDPTLREKSLAAFADELSRCDALGIPYLVLHPGSNPELDRGIALIAEGLDACFARAAGASTAVLLETTAGQGNTIGHRFEHLAAILARVERPERLGVCVDSCHLFMAGYDLATVDGYEKTFDELHEAVGLERVKAFHLNDCKKPFGARVDRHEEIGKGTLGLQAFDWLVNDPRFERTVGVLETPDFKAYSESLELLRGLQGKGGRKPSPLRP